MYFKSTIKHKISKSENNLDNKILETMKNIVENTTPVIDRHKNNVQIRFEQSSLPINMINGRGRNRKNVTVISDYDLAYSERLYEKEGIVRKFVVTSTAKLMRARFDLVENPHFVGSSAERTKRHKLLMTKIQGIMIKSNMTWIEFVQTISKELLQYGNSFISKHKNKKNNKIEWINSDDPLFYAVTLDRKTFKPVSYLRRPYLRPKTYSEDTFNNIKGTLGLLPSLTANDQLLRDMMVVYGQSGLGSTGVSSDEEIIPLDRMIHIKYMIEKNAGLALPPALAGHVDIEDLRTLEENLILLGWQYGHPILHISVDSTGLSPAAIETEIRRTIQAVENMDSTGFLATSHRVKVELHYPNGSSVPIDKFVSYLQSRIKGNLDTAALLLGDGADAGRQAGETIESASNDINQMIARVIAERLQLQLIDELYNEEYNNIDNTGCCTIIKVKEIDRNRAAARINQLVNMTNSLMVSPDVIRDEMDFPPIGKDEELKIRKYAEIRDFNKLDGTSNPQNQYGEQTPGTTKD